MSRVRSGCISNMIWPWDLWQKSLWVKCAREMPENYFQVGNSTAKGRTYFEERWISQSLGNSNDELQLWKLHLITWVIPHHFATPLYFVQSIIIRRGVIHISTSPELFNRFDWILVWKSISRPFERFFPLNSLMHIE